MSDQHAEHDMKELAALHALSALSQAEAHAFERHVAEGCEVCGRELETFERTVGALAFASPPIEPPSSVREELITRTAQFDQLSKSQSSDRAQFISILSTEGDWLDVGEGVRLKKMYVDRATGIATSLVRMLPGASLPPHQHLGVEQFFVIEGDCNVAGQRLEPGDYHRAKEGSTHETTYTTGGTMFLLIAPERYAVLEAR